MRVHSVLLVPAFGHSDASGAYDMGESIGKFSELDVIDGYLPTLVDELDLDGIRYEVMPTRTRPGVKADDRFKRVEQNQLVLHLGAGFYKGRNPPMKNISVVYCGSQASRDIAKELAEALSTWGQCYVWGHRGARPEPLKADPLLNVENTMAVKIEPFLLNGPDADEYLARLPALGSALGRAVSSYLMVRNHARGRVAMSMENRR